MGHHVFTQVQVEARVQHVDPLGAAHLQRLDPLDRAGMDLDTPHAADEHHDGRAIHGRLVQQPVHCVLAQAMGKPAFGQAEALLALHPELAQQTEEFMGVLHHRPGGFQPCCVDLGISARTFRDRRGGKHITRPGLREAGHQGIERSTVGLLTHKHLVHGRAMGIEELQALRRRFGRIVGGLGYGKARMPMHEKKTQVDGLTECQAHRAGGRHILVDTRLLMHGGGIPGQG